VTTEKQISRLTWLLQPPGKINGKNVLQHINRLNTIEALAIPEGVERTVHQNRLLKLAREGRKMSSRESRYFSAMRITSSGALASFSRLAACLMLIYSV